MKTEFKYWKFNLPRNNKVMGYFDGFYGIIVSGKKFIGISYHYNIALCKPFKISKFKKTEKVLDFWFYIFFACFQLSFRFGRSKDN